MHEAWVSIEDNNEVPQCGVEPSTWLRRRSGVLKHLKSTGLDLWKHSGDFQSFHRKLLSLVEYPLGSYGWGWGDIELRLRVQEAGFGEEWNRDAPVWHMYHPYTSWSIREQSCFSNMNLWNRDIIFDDEGWVSPPLESQNYLLRASGKYCYLKQNSAVQEIGNYNVKKLCTGRNGL